MWVCSVEQHTQRLRGKTFRVWGVGCDWGPPNSLCPILGICPPFLCDDGDGEESDSQRAQPWGL